MCGTADRVPAMTSGPATIVATWLLSRAVSFPSSKVMKRSVATADTAVSRLSARTMNDPRLYRLIFLAALFSTGHHIDHLIRGNAVGWSVTPEVNGFTASLVIYPLILTGLALYRAGRVGPDFWIAVSGGGALFVGAVHFGPLAIEPPPAIVDHYDSPILGWFAFAWLIVLIGVLVVSSVYEARLWWRARRAGSSPSTPGAEASDSAAKA